MDQHLHRDRPARSPAQRTGAERTEAEYIGAERIGAERIGAASIETFRTLLRHYHSEHQAAGRCQAGLERLRTRLARSGWLLSPDALRSLVGRDRASLARDSRPHRAPHALRVGNPSQKGSCSRASTAAKAARNSP